MTSDKSYAVERRLALLNLAVDNTGILIFTSPTDGNDYTVGTCIKHILTGNHNILINSTTPISIPDLVWGVAARRYNLEGLIVATSGAAAGTRNYRLTGPAISEFELMCRQDQVNTATLVSGQTHESYQFGDVTNGGGYNAGAMSGPAMNNIGQVMVDEFRCSFTFTAPGTLQLKAAEGTASDPWTVNYGYLQLTAT